MNISMNADWARLKRHGIAMLGRDGFADWLAHAAAVVRVEARREAINALWAERATDDPGAITRTVAT